MNQLEDMRLFVDTVELGSFTAAAERQGYTKQYISKRMMALESRLGVRLLNRTTRRLSLTELGNEYYQQARRVIDDVERVEQRISQQNTAPRGLLRVSAPMTFGTLHLSPVLPRFLARYPDVSVEIDLNDRTVDLVAEGYDMAIRIGALPDSSLVARRIGTMEMATCAAPGYLDRHGHPEVPQSVREHHCVLYGHTRNVEWLFSIEGQVRAISVHGRMRTNNGELVRDAALAGLGLAHLPTFIVGPCLRQQRLLSVLDAFRPPVMGIHAVYPGHRQSSLLVTAFNDFLRQHFDTGDQPNLVA